MTAARKFKTTPVRKGLIAKVKIAQKQLGIDDDLYRDMLVGQFGGRTSATELTIGELEELVASLKAKGARFTKRPPVRAGGRKLASGIEAAKMRALWISLYNLGVVRDPSEQALANFARRVSGGRDRGVAALQWLDGGQAVKVVEALKDWAQRQAGVNWDPYRNIIGRGPVHRPRMRVIEAQWAILMKLDEAKLAFGLNGYASRLIGTDDNNIIANMTEIEQDRIIESLGAWIRRALAKRGLASVKDIAEVITT